MGFDINKPYQCRDGRRAKAIAAPNGVLFGFILNDCDDAFDHVWDVNGRSHRTANRRDSDLVNVPERRTIKVWINCYPPDHHHSPQLFGDRRTADTYSSGRIACIERTIEFEVGEGL